MMGTVVSIKGGPVEPEQVEPCAPLITLLEKLLEDAKCGRLQSFIGVGFQDDGDMHYLMCDFHEREMEMYGALQWITQHYYMQHFVEEDAET